MIKNRTHALSASLLAIAVLGNIPFYSSAGEYRQENSFQFFDEMRLGILAADLEPGGASDDAVAVNAEFLTSKISGEYGDPFLNAFLTPRFHLGAIFSAGKGVNQGYAGLTWDYRLTDAIFLETSFGAAVHDGKTQAHNPDSYGCTAQFRESLSVGVEVTEQINLIATVDHMSNAGLCDENQGVTNAGVRLGYRW